MRDNDEKEIGNENNMGENTKNDNIKQDNIDDQVVNSIQKLVEEETNVARAAFVHEISGKQQNGTASGHGAGESEDPLQRMHTQVIQIPKDYPFKEKEGQNATEESMKNGTSETEQSQKKTLTQKNKIIIGVVAAAVVLLIIGIAVFVVQNNNRNSYTYNYDRGMAYFQEEEYAQALPFLEKATSADQGKNNSDLFYDLYLCYRNTDADDEALETLREILSFDKNNEKAIKAIAAFYMEKKDSESLNALISSYKGTEGEAYLSDYIVNKPAPSTDSGSYNENVKLQFVMDTDCKVYYTLDGSEPTTQSTLYNGIIEIKSGTTTVKAISVNSMGVYSEVVEFKYEIDYKKPDAPEVSPASGTYEAGQIITVDNLPEGSVAYYTTDGSTPTENSTRYTEGFEMPEGNTIVSVIVVDQNNQTSAVTRRNYVVSKTNARQMTYDEALIILKAQLQNKGILLQDGNTTANGGNATFVYQSRITVQGEEVYYVRCDVRTNGTVSTEGYYGIGVYDGNCYQVVQGGGVYTLSQL